MANFCGNCGEKLEEGMIFCGECGSQVEEMPRTQPEAKPINQPEAKSIIQPAMKPINQPQSHIQPSTNEKTKAPWLIILVVALVAVMAGGYWMMTRGGEEKDAPLSVDTNTSTVEDVKADEPDTTSEAEVVVAEQPILDDYTLSQLVGIYIGKVKVSFSDNINDMGITEEEKNYLLTTPSVKIQIQGDQLTFGFYDTEYESYSDMPPMTVTYEGNTLKGTAVVTDLATADFEGVTEMVMVDDVDQMTLTGKCIIEFQTADGKGATVTFDFETAR